jgi:hypothetical protein
MTRKRATPAISDIIAERAFQRADGKEVRTIVGRPRKVKREWVCEFQVLGVGHDKVYKTSGEDSLEALQAAIGMMVIQVETDYKHDYGLTFLGDSHLGLWMYDFEKMQREIEATPDYVKWRHVLDRVWDR